MKTQSIKAKGRRLQQQIVSELYAAFPALGEGDLVSTSSGANGEDVRMSQLARRIIPYSFEAKNQERLNVWAALDQAHSNCDARIPVVVIKRNNARPFAILPFGEFVRLISKDRGEGKAPSTAEELLPEPTTAQLPDVERPPTGGDHLSILACRFEAMAAEMAEASRILRGGGGAAQGG